MSGNRELQEHTCFICQRIFLSTKKRKLVFCLVCQKSDLYQMAVKIRLNLRRARKLGLPATLTLEEWLETIAYFQGKCAYCQKLPYTCIEHYIPLELGGGTTRGNALPSCRGCNHHKKSFPPETKFSQDIINRIQAFFSSLDNEVEE